MAKPIGKQALNTSVIAEFVVGDPEAKADDVLLHAPLTIRGTREFLTGRKSVVIGERGAGKSALFRLIAEGKFRFAPEPTEMLRNEVIVPIDDELEYLTIANVIESRFAPLSQNRYGKYRFLWEIYIFMRVADSIEDRGFGAEKLDAIRNELCNVLGARVHKKMTLKSLLSAFKLSGGIKVDQVGSVTPSVSIEPTTPQANSPMPVSDREIVEIRNQLRQVLNTENLAVIVLVDRVDDFVVGTSYEEQQKNLQALLECATYYRFPELKVKVFMRADLYLRLNFEKLAFDKIANQVVRLEWTREDIAEFVARRLLHNYSRLQIPIPRGNVASTFLDVDPSLRLSMAELLRTSPRGKGQLFFAIVRALGIAAKVKWQRMWLKSHTARKTDFVHDSALALITFIFPARVPVFDASCKKEEIAIEEFFGTRFRLGGENPNPRLVLLFLSRVFETSSSYYLKNPDKRELEENDAGEFELILKEHVLRGYQELQDVARTTIAQLNNGWRSYVERLYAKASHPPECSSVSVSDLRSMIDWDRDDNEFKQFLAFYTHIGLLMALNPSAPLDKRLFRLPIVLVKCHPNRATHSNL